MIRKLVSSLLCAFALLLLMGAGTASEQTTPILAEEESGALSGSALTTETQTWWSRAPRRYPPRPARAPLR